MQTEILFESTDIGLRHLISHLTVTGAVSFSAEQKHTNIINNIKNRFFYQKNDRESVFGVEIFEIKLSNFIFMCVF